TLF
ncbi:phosphoglucomutase/phosphomannomutase, C-terminal domain protein, partial [Chlamydia psittaci 08-2626_L3]